MSSAAESSYDAVPYQSNPFPQSQPDRLAVVARLFGLQPALLSQANVFELGASLAQFMPGLVEENLRLLESAALLE